MVAYKNSDVEQVEFPTKAHASRFPESFGAQCVEMTVLPGGSIPVHAKPVNVLFYVLEGEVTAIIGDERSTAGVGTLIESPVELEHGLENTSERIAIVLIIKLPK